MPYTESASVFSEPDTPHAYRSANAMLDGALSPEAVRSVLDVVGPGAEAMCVTSLRHLGGAFSREPAVPNAVSNREAEYVFYVLSPLEPAGEAVVRGVHDRAMEAVSDRTTGRNLNFLYGPQDEATVRPVFERGTARRLARLKALHDPEGLFPFNQAQHKGS